MKKITGLLLRPQQSRRLSAALLLVGLLVNRSKHSKPEKIAAQLYAGLPSFCRSALRAEDKVALLAAIRAGAQFISRLTTL